MNQFKKVGKKLSKAKTAIITIVLLSVLGIATIYAAAANSCTITISVDGIENKITTLRTDANEIIKQAGITVDENDVVDLSDYISGVNSTIRINRSYNIIVFDGGNKGVEYRGNGTVEEVFKQNGIKLKDGDEVSCAPDEMIFEGKEIVIARAFPVKITADGETTSVNMASGCVSDALDKAVITLDDDDIISSPLDSSVKKGMEITINRVTFEDRVEKAEVNFKTVKKNTDKLYVGQSKTETKGVKGEKEITYRDQYVDGVLKETKEIKSAVTKPPVDEVKLVGTKKKPTNSAEGAKLANGVKTISRLTPPASLSLNGNVPTSYKKKIVGTASAYSGGGVTATGKSVMPGYIAVNPRQIPYHTKMWIVSSDGRFVYGYASAEDTGGFINWTGSRATVCDLYMASESQASAFGRRSVTIYIL